MGNDTLDIVDPADGTTITTIDLAGRQDVERAVVRAIVRDRMKKVAR